MGSLNRLLAAAAGFFAALAAGAAAHEATPRNSRHLCGDQLHAGAGFFDVHAKRVGCTHARWVARRWSDRTLAGDEPARVGRFTCHSRSDHPKSEFVSVLCVRDGGRRAVRFHWGS